MVLFNRFLEPDIDLDTMQLSPQLYSAALTNSGQPFDGLRFCEIRFPFLLGATGGIHCPDDVIKLVLAGADACLSHSTLLQTRPRICRRDATGHGDVA